ncbi:MAG: hypothetical protein RLZZ126_409 [Pseudomonadota bacterium]
MIHTPLPTVLVLASGRGERFRASGGQGHKLDALLAGKPVLQHVLDAARASGLPWHLERAQHAGLGDCIAAAVAATPDAAGWLMVLGDLPLVQPRTLRAVAQALQQHDVVVPVVNGQRGHPVGFSRRCHDELLTLNGDIGAAAVVRARGALELPVDDQGCVTDVDTVQALAEAERLFHVQKN